MQTLNNAELAFLSLLSYPKLAVKSLKLYSNNSVLFPKAIWPHLDLMWTAYMTTLSNNRDKGLSVGKDIIAANLSEAVQSDHYMTEEALEKSDMILQRFLTGDVPTEEEGIVFIQKVAQMDAGRKLMASISSNADFASLENTISRVRQQVEDLSEKADDNDKVVYKPFQEIQDLTPMTPRIPCGINWMDELTSGGGREQELWLILGGTSGGKTSLTIQYACAQALMGNSTVFATYEQSLAGDLAERIISNVTGESLDKIRDIGFNNLPEELQRKFWASVAGADDKLTVLDMTHRTQASEIDPRDNGGVYSIWQEVKKIKASGQNVKTVLIDWMGAMLEVVAACTGRELENAFQFMAQREINIARKMAKEEHLLVIFFHQTDTKSQHARPIYAPDKTCALNMKTMSNFMDLTLTLGNRDTHNILWANGAKVRKGANIMMTIRLIGDHCKFVPAPGWYPNTDGNFYNPAEVQLSPSQPAENEVTPFSREIE
jgi:RecA/RadA recombinase